MSSEDVVRSVTSKLVYKIDLKDEEFYKAVNSVFTVDMPDAVIASFLTALTTAGITKREIKIIRKVLRQESVSVFAFGSVTFQYLVSPCKTNIKPSEFFHICLKNNILVLIFDHI